jgi:2-hydroxy-3-oxopropionate reductase
VRIGFIGLGRMGLPMATNLLRAGHEVTGCDLSPARTALFAERGGKVATTPAAAARSAEATLSMVMDDAVLREVTYGPDGVFAGAGGGHIYADLSTVTPGASADVGARAATAGIIYLCAKVSGSVGLAEEGGLTLFASGPAEAFHQLAPVFGAMARLVRHVGTGNEAATLKLVHSLIVGVYSAMLGEALAFGERGGLDLGAMLDILEPGPLGSKQLTLKAPVLRERRFDAPPSDIDTAAKDMDLILQTARQLSAPLPLASTARQMMAMAQAHGNGKREIYSILETFEALANITPPRAPA